MKSIMHFGAFSSGFLCQCKQNKADDRSGTIEHLKCSSFDDSKILIAINLQNL